MDTKMAKETKAERQAREELEAEASYQAFVREYPVRFAAVMFNMMNESHVFTVTKLDAETYEFKRSEDRWSEVTLKVTPPANRNWEAVNVLEEAERLVTNYKEEQAEELRKYQARNAALAKLTAEERELLNL